LLAVGVVGEHRLPHPTAGSLAWFASSSRPWRSTSWSGSSRAPQRQGHDQLAVPRPPLRRDRRGAAADEPVGPAGRRRWSDDHCRRGRHPGASGPPTKSWSAPP